MHIYKWSSQIILWLRWNHDGLCCLGVTQVLLLGLKNGRKGTASSINISKQADMASISGNTCYHAKSLGLRHCPLVVNNAVTSAKQEIVIVISANPLGTINL